MAMEREFIHDDFLLGSDAARELYHGHAERMPILDYHNHLSPRQVAEDYRADNIAQLWLGGDHYKWRAMRAAGVDERYGRSLPVGPKRYPRPCVIRSTTGRHLN